MIDGFTPERLKMLRSLAKIAAYAALAFGLLLGTSAAAVPAVRHVISAWWNSPSGLAALPENPLVHYEDGARDQARAVAAALPAALARIEAAQGRPFAHPVTIGVYVTPKSYATANGLGTPKVGAVTVFGRVTLSPDLFSTQRERMEAVLTHELSHAHLQGWLTSLAYLRLPNWFKEGLAVMVSSGGGAEGVSEAEAHDAIRRGDRIAIQAEGSFFNLVAVKFEKNPPEIPLDATRAHMAYRQAGLFVAYLHDTDPSSFAEMMEMILRRRPFAEAVEAAYALDLPTLWSRFDHTIAN